MTDKITLSPDEIHQLAFEEGQPAENGDGYLFTAEESDLFVQRLLDAALAEPVPPAGGEPEDFEVWWATYPLGDSVDPNSKADRLNARLTWDARNVHFTRLQAEFVTQLQDLKRERQKAWDQRDTLQSELTKARELLQDLKDMAARSLPDSLYSRIYEYLANQSASADKGQSEPVDMQFPSEDELIANGLGYPIGKEGAIKLHFAGFRSGVITILEAWDAIGHEMGCNPSKDELLDSLRNIAAICDAHGNDMPAEQPASVAVVLAEAREWLGDGKHADGLAREHWTSGERPTWTDDGRCDRTVHSEPDRQKGIAHQVIADHRQNCGPETNKGLR